MPNLRNVLNELKWGRKFNFDDAKIWYVHRGVPNDTKIISGKEIVTIGQSFMETATAMIPYHRIFKIVYKGDIIFKR